jgi:hypothetical protein
MEPGVRAGVGHSDRGLGPDGELVLPVAAARNFLRRFIRSLHLISVAVAGPCQKQFTITSRTFQLIVNTTADGAGGIHFDVRGNAQGVRAQGLTSATCTAWPVISGASRRSGMAAIRLRSPWLRSTTP